MIPFPARARERLAALLPARPAADVRSPEAVTRRTPVFWITAAIGAAGIVWGLRGVLTHDIDTRPTNMGKFFLGGVIVHDAIFAPVVLAAGVTVSRLVRGRARAYVQAALIIGGYVALFAYPEIRGYGHINHNPTSLPYNYTANFLAVAGAVLVAVVVAAAGQALLPRRRPAVVDAGGSGGSSGSGGSGAEGAGAGAEGGEAGAEGGGSGDSGVVDAEGGGSGAEGAGAGGSGALDAEGGGSEHGGEGGPGGDVGTTP